MIKCLNVKFADPTCVNFWDIIWKKQTAVNTVRMWLWSMW